MSVGVKAPIAKGRVSRRDGLSFGGKNHLPAADAKLERIIVVIWDESSESRFEVEIGASIDFAGQTWRLDEINAGDWDWNAIMTRTA